MMSRFPEQYVQTLALLTQTLRQRHPEAQQWDTVGIAAAIRDFPIDDPTVVAVSFIEGAARTAIRTPKGVPVAIHDGFKPLETPTPRAARCGTHPEIRLVGGLCERCVDFVPSPRPRGKEWDRLVASGRDEEPL